MMKTKLFCTDLDDTLLRKDKSIPEDNIKAIREMTEAGHLFAIVTGRSINGGRMVFDQLGIGTHNCYLASFHGNVLYDLEAEKILFSNGMDQDFTIRLLKECKKAGGRRPSRLCDLLHELLHDGKTRTAGRKPRSQLIMSVTP